MNRVKSSHVFSFSGGDLDQSPAKRGDDDLVVDLGIDTWFSPSESSTPSSSASSSSSPSSSIGRNSDDDDNEGKSSEENEAESTYKGPLDLMESLEEVLPIRKGISKYYNGKSKSFTSLVEAASTLSSSSSMKDLAKPENPYSRRRRNLLCHQIWENSKTTPRGGISKKHIMSSSRSALTLAMAVAAAGVTTGGEGSSSGGSSPTTSGSPPRQRHRLHQMLPPLHPRSQGSFGNLTTPAWRSYSVADLPRCFPATAGDS